MFPMLRNRSYLHGSMRLSCPRFGSSMQTIVQVKSRTFSMPSKLSCYRWTLLYNGDVERASLGDWRFVRAPECGCAAAPARSESLPDSSPQRWVRGRCLDGYLDCDSCQCESAATRPGRRGVIGQETGLHHDPTTERRRSSRADRRLHEMGADPGPDLGYGSSPAGIFAPLRAAGRSAPTAG